MSPDTLLLITGAAERLVQYLITQFQEVFQPVETQAQYLIVNMYLWPVSNGCNQRDGRVCVVTIPNLSQILLINTNSFCYNSWSRICEG